MADHYTTNLTAVRTESGNIVVRLGHPLDGFTLVTLTGPAFVTPPANEMTDAEYDRWQFDLCYGSGYHISVASAILNAPVPLIVVHRTCEDRIPKGSVERTFHIAETARGDRALVLELVSRWNESIPNVEAHVGWEAETPQPVPNAPASLGLLEHGASVKLVRTSPLGAPDLFPGLPAGFALPPSMDRGIRSSAAALSPERLYVALFTDGYEFDRIPGEALVVALDQLDG